MINNRHRPTANVSTAPSVGQPETLSHLLPQAEKVRKSLTRFSVAALGPARGEARPFPEADAAVTQLVRGLRGGALNGAIDFDAALQLIAHLTQMNTTVRPQTHGEGPHFMVLSAQVLKDLRLVALDAIAAAVREGQSSRHQHHADLGVVLPHLQAMAQRLHKDLKTPSEGSAAPSSEGDSYLLSPDTSKSSVESAARPTGPARGVVPPQPKAPSAAEARRAAPPSPPTFKGVPGVSIHLPHDPLPEAPTSIKIKWPKELYADQPFAGQQYSKLYDAKGRSYVLTETFARGGFGKARRAYSMEEPELELVAKELRHVRSRNARRNGDEPTRVVSREQAVVEAHMTQTNRRTIEKDMAAYDALPPEHQDSLQRARAHAMPFTLYGIIKNNAKTIIMMSRDLGSVASLRGQIIGPNHVFAVKSLAAQVYSELQALHETCNKAHLDLSEGNVFVTRSGQFKLMDFGGEEPLHQGRTNKNGIRGTLLTPEAVGFSHDEVQGYYLTSATDVFAAAAMIAHFAADRPGKHIFAHNFRMPGTRTSHDSGVELFHAFQSWRETLADPTTGRISAAAILAAEDDLFSPFFTPLAEMAPDLCETLINDAMALAIKDRKSAGDLARTARGLLPTRLIARDSFVRALGALEASADRDEDFDQAALFHDWEVRQTEQHQSKLSAQRGQPRNLPG